MGVQAGQGVVVGLVETLEEVAAVEEEEAGEQMKKKLEAERVKVAGYQHRLG